MRYFSQEGANLAPVAEFLDIILYSRQQIDEENAAMSEKDPFSQLNYEWGVVSVKPTHTDCELPMDPITMMRNALGKEYGGSGVPLNPAKYLESVQFWSNYARIRS